MSGQVEGLPGIPARDELVRSRHVRCMGLYGHVCVLCDEKDLERYSRR